MPYPTANSQPGPNYGHQRQRPVARDSPNLDVIHMTEQYSGQLMSNHALPNPRANPASSRPPNPTSGSYPYPYNSSLNPPALNPPRQSNQTANYAANMNAVSTANLQQNRPPHLPTNSASALPQYRSTPQPRARNNNTANYAAMNNSPLLSMNSTPNLQQTTRSPLLPVNSSPMLPHDRQVKYPRQSNHSANHANHGAASNNSTHSPLLSVNSPSNRPSLHMNNSSPNLRTKPPPDPPPNSNHGNPSKRSRPTSTLVDETALWDYGVLMSDVDQQRAPPSTTTTFPYNVSAPHPGPASSLTTSDAPFTYNTAAPHYSPTQSPAPSSPTTTFPLTLPVTTQTQLPMNSAANSFSTNSFGKSPSPAYQQPQYNSSLSRNDFSSASQKDFTSIPVTANPQRNEFAVPNLPSATASPRKRRGETLPVTLPNQNQNQQNQNFSTASPQQRYRDAVSEAPEIDNTLTALQKRRQLAAGRSSLGPLPLPGPNTDNINNQGGTVDPRGTLDPRNTVDPRGTLDPRNTVDPRGTLDPRGTVDPRGGILDPRGTINPGETVNPGAIQRESTTINTDVIQPRATPASPEMQKLRRIAAALDGPTIARPQQQVQQIQMTPKMSQAQAQAQQTAQVAQTPMATMVETSTPAPMSPARRRYYAAIRGEYRFPIPLLELCQSTPSSGSGSNSNSSNTNNASNQRNTTLPISIPFSTPQLKELVLNGFMKRHSSWLHPWGQAAEVILAADMNFRNPRWIEYVEEFSQAFCGVEFGLEGVGVKLDCGFVVGGRGETEGDTDTEGDMMEGFGKIFQPSTTTTTTTTTTSTTTTQPPQPFGKMLIILPSPHSVRLEIGREGQDTGYMLQSEIGNLTIGIWYNGALPRVWTDGTVLCLLYELLPPSSGCDETVLQIPPVEGDGR
ncbi:hypothetical protein BZA77DRAFT_352244 [Pyronema omphalodes]|nr:hypothetical protein BZA77DRAFT_352244 [Pyronema omphalodes]